MCLIFVNKSGQKFSRKALINAASSNRDGVGLLLWDGEKWNAEKHLKIKNEDIFDRIGGYSQFAIHYRLSTHGLISEDNCHPFSLGGGWWLMHNGILPIKPIKKEHSDTRQLANHLRKLEWATIDQKKREALFHIVHAMAGNDRLLFAAPDGKLYRYGTWHERDEGWYSNTGCLYSYAKTKYGSLNTYYGGAITSTRSHIDDDYTSDYVTGGKDYYKQEYDPTTRTWRPKTGEAK